VLELASREDIAACERDVSLEDLYCAQEAFLTSAGIGAMPLTEVGDRPIGTGRPGPVTERLMAAYRKLVLAECGR
jgi:branched-subunit amino acid aminotransferase/4-amino-4-deoxychorismate lyase